MSRSQGSNESPCGLDVPACCSRNLLDRISTRSERRAYSTALSTKPLSQGEDLRCGQHVGKSGHCPESHELAPLSGLLRRTKGAARVFNKCQRQDIPLSILNRDDFTEVNAVDQVLAFIVCQLSIISSQVRLHHPLPGRLEWDGGRVQGRPGPPRVHAGKLQGLCSSCLECHLLPRNMYLSRARTSGEPRRYTGRLHRTLVGLQRVLQGLIAEFLKLALVQVQFAQPYWSIRPLWRQGRSLKLCDLCLPSIEAHVVAFSFKFENQTALQVAEAVQKQLAAEA